MHLYFNITPPASKNHAKIPIITRNKEIDNALGISSASLI